MARHRQCTTCNKDWPASADSMTAIGEGAVRDGEDGKRRVRKSVENSDDEEDEDMDDGPSQPRTQQSRKNKGKQAADESMDVDEDEDDSDTPVKKAQGKRRG